MAAAVADFVRRNEHLWERENWQAPVVVRHYWRLRRLQQSLDRQRLGADS